MIISFAGHASVPSNNELKEIIKDQIRKNITSSDFITFYLGGYGAFDEVCALACRELKKEYKNVELVYVTPYINLQKQDELRNIKNLNLYDASIYPPIEDAPPKLAILKRNEWMMKNADLIIVYVDHNYGGAYRSLQVAKRSKKSIINIVDVLKRHR